MLFYYLALFVVERAAPHFEVFQIKGIYQNWRLAISSKNAG